MAQVPIYVIKIEADPSPYRAEGDIRNRTHYLASMLWPGGFIGKGDTPEEAKADLQAQATKHFREQGVVEVRNDTLDLDL